jgi:hypothetical protein
MIKKKCSGCGKKIERKFSFCPYCGFNFKGVREEENYGLLGRNDIDEPVRKQSFGLNGMIENMLNDLTKQLQGGMNGAGMPRGFKIQVSTGKPVQRQVVRKSEDKFPKLIKEEVSEKEIERRKKLEVVEAESYIRRLPEAVIYELKTPGVSSKKDVVITRLEGALEVRVYSKDKCYYRAVPLKLEFIGYSVSKDKVSLKFKN